MLRTQVIRMTVVKTNDHIVVLCDRYLIQISFHNNGKKYIDRSNEILHTLKLNWKVFKTDNPKETLSDLEYIYNIFARYEL